MDQGLYVMFNLVYVLCGIDPHISVMSLALAVPPTYTAFFRLLAVLVFLSLRCFEWAVSRLPYGDYFGINSAWLGNFTKTMAKYHQ